MSVKEISAERFHDHYVSPMSSFMGEEMRWYQDEENNLLGTVILDKIDKDWSYVIMALDTDGQYAAIDINVSITSEDECALKMLNKFKDLVVSGEFREEFYTATKPSPTIYLTDINMEVKKYLNKHPEKIYDLTPRRFEELIASILQDIGFDVELTKATRDGGSDIIACIRNAVTSFLILIECKKYSLENKVDVGIVRQVMGVHSLRQPSKSIIVTTSTFTRDAKKEASLHKEKLDLKDYKDLKEWLSKY